MTDGTRSNDSRRGSTLLLAVLAMAVTQLFRAEHQWHAWLVVVESVLTLVCVFLLMWYTARCPAAAGESGCGNPGAAAVPRGWITGATAITLLPVLVQAVARRYDVADPNEIVMMMCLQNAALAAAVASPWWRYRQMAFLLSGFLTLFVLFSTTQPPVLAAGSLYAFVGLWCLMGHYWDRLTLRMATHTRRLVPVRGVVFVLTTLVLCLAATLTLAWSRGVAPRFLAGFMPTSGGDRRGGDQGRGGVGDGDQLVGGQDHASSFGPVETDLFLSSEQPSLYDTYSNAYGEPARARQHRAIMLESGLERESHGKMAQSKQAAREFDAIRRPPAARHHHVDDRDCDALLFVVGRTPLHLRLETYDHFDGACWSHSSPGGDPRAFEVRAIAGKPWMQLDVHDPCQVLVGKQTHAVKIINLDTSRVPAPAMLAAWHVDRVDRPDFFAWTADDVLELVAHDRLPPLTVVHLVSRGINIRAVDAIPLFDTRGVGDAYLQLDSGQHRDVARAWTAGTPRGLAQIEQIVHRLRSTMVHDPDAAAPEDCRDVVGHFLRTGRGPDYLFATTATMLLRCLGYPARVVSGFYTDADDYDARSGQTIVRARNVHFWVEARIPGGYWVPLEPTPGYAQPVGLLTWRQRLARFVREVREWGGNHRLALGTCAVLAVGSMVFRRRLSDACWYAVFLIALRGPPRRQVLWTLRLLEWRGGLSGWRRPGACTVARWYGSWPVVLAEERADLQELVRCSDWALYGTSSTPLPPMSWPEVRRLCRRVAGAWTASRLARHRATIQQRSRGRVLLSSWLARLMPRRTQH